MLALYFVQLRAAAAWASDRIGVNSISDPVATRYRGQRASLVVAMSHVGLRLVAIILASVSASAVGSDAQARRGHRHYGCVHHHFAGFAAPPGPVTSPTIISPITILAAEAPVTRLPNETQRRMPAMATMAVFVTGASIR
jgi:hypothetical protein